MLMYFSIYFKLLKKKKILQYAKLKKSKHLAIAV